MTIQKPRVGQFTFEQEGQEGGRYHSRVLHVPSKYSGLTIGRGFDLKHRSSEQILKALSEAGVAFGDAEVLAKASGLYGSQAQQFIKKHGLEGFEVSPKEQVILFEQTYEVMSKDVKRICDKADCVEVYGPVDWENLHPKIKDILIDLRYRGDYTPATRRRIQRYVVQNDLEAFSKEMSDRELWNTVPSERFKQRLAYLITT
ncbi:hypothetical protein [Pseudoalteromonas luteoviolacea]|uniref:Pesticin C-terminal domain-containing protein n=1 Tax=Pseudoalteromonas luteoviolacea S4054 TaxID=1129367 RepID=A0A0F6ABG0_9GAMM|nr:hypothetical protein [Pseudoalteromonas luteoviolacea]AOT08498.1 hypothetical protein S4054249_11860 [Pseudoalteromonas luteoviolacea]AOT13414.1 hypothetical protein S40542_11835 [Pseudoalteromonas luteoviolacea]AOT18327.1 hypothetical protein S4054_11835 [Pseudoalteromonas luteoviolacea]KKE83505.1 hypothetical protein N479_14130 [Pseudoalteromonas luteoviolacea S4054]KZN75942.1 hypothetical protein N481_06225 [Pseudoalteromonas luteoviolacea S4047-1]